jgi:hypothetical protein
MLSGSYVPAVVIASVIGWRRAPIAVSSTSHTPRSLCAWSSSTMFPCGLRPSRVFESAPSGSNFDCSRSTWRLFRYAFTNRFSCELAFTIAAAVSQTIFAWSFFVALA